jgi:hypothetical protein
MEKYQEVEFDLERLFRLLQNIPEGDILIGGQALAVWVNYYDITDPYVEEDFLTIDVDIFGTDNTLIRLKDKLGGFIEYPPTKGFGTSLIGQLTIPLGNGKSNHVDVLKKVPGLNANFKKRSSFIFLKREGFESEFKVLHPMDSFMNKIYNLANFEEKQDEKGIKQARLSITVVNHYIKDLIKNNNHRLAIKAVENIAKIARSTIGKNNRNFGVEIYDGIPVNDLKTISVSPFVENRLPRLLEDICLVKNNDEIKP